MSKTIRETTGNQGQTYTTKMETQPGVSPRFGPQGNKVKDAGKDVSSLLGSKASKTKQEHMVSVGIAQTMASDHITALNEEITFINNQLGPTESRDIAIKRLQSSIATTSGVSAGLSGDAAQAYDELYIPNARKMSTKAMSFWDGEQKEIDKSRMVNEFEKFISNTYTSLDPVGAESLLAVWKGRASMVDPGMANKMDLAAGDATVNHIVKTAKSDPTLTPIQIADKFRNIGLFGQVEVAADGEITYGTSNVENQAKIATVLDSIFDAEERYINSNATVGNVAYEKEQKRRLSVFKTLVATIPDADSVAGRAAIKKLHKDIFGNTATSPRGIKGSVVANDMGVTDYIVGIESKGKYNVWNGGTEYSRKGQSNGTGGEYSSAFGRYQFIKETAETQWKRAQAAGTIPKTKTMVHGQQTPSEQDAMWRVQLGDLRKDAKSLGIPQTNENLYMIHQLGEPNARDYIKNDMPNDTTIKAMNAQLGKASLGNPLSDPSYVKAEWERKYRPNGGAAAIASVNPKTTKVEAELIAELAKGENKEDTNIRKSNQESVKEKEKAIDESMVTIVKSLDKMTDDDPSDENFGKMLTKMHDFNDLLKEQGRDPMFSAADLMDVNNIQDIRKLVQKRATAKVMRDTYTKEYTAKVKFDNKAYRDEAENLVKEYKNNPATENASKIHKHMIAANASNKKLGLPPVFTEGEMQRSAVMDDTAGIEAQMKIGEGEQAKWSDEQKSMVEEAKKTAKLALDKMASEPENQTFYKDKAVQALRDANKKFIKNGEPAPFDLADIAAPKFALSVQKRNELDKQYDKMTENSKAEFVADMEVQIKEDKAVIDGLRKRWEGNKTKENYSKLQKEIKARSKFYKDKTTEDPFTGELSANAIATMIADDKATSDAAKVYSGIAQKEHIKTTVAAISNMEKAVSKKIREGELNPSKRGEVKVGMDNANAYAAENNMPVVYSREIMAAVDSDFQAYDAEQDASLLRDAVGNAKSIFEYNKDKPLSEVIKDEIGKVSFSSEKGGANAKREIEKVKTVEAQTKVRSSYALAASITKNLDTNKKLAEIEKLKPYIDKGIWDKEIQNKIDDYMKSGDKIVEDAIASEINEPYSVSDFRTKKDYDRYKNARMKQLDNLFQRDHVQIVDAYSMQDPTVRADFEVSVGFAAGKVKATLTSLNNLSALVKKNPELWSNSMFKSYAMQGLSKEDNSKLTAMLSIISVMPNKNYDPRLSKALNMTVKASWEGAATRAANGEEVDYSTSTEMDEFTGNVQELLKVPVDERIGLMMVARSLDTMGFSQVIPTLWNSLSSKYVKDDELGGRLAPTKGHWQTQVRGDPAKMAAWVEKSLVIRNGMTKELATAHKQNALDGEYLIGTNESGSTMITFPDREGRYNMEQKQYELLNEDYVIDINNDTESRYYQLRDGTKVLKTSRRGKEYSTNIVSDIKIRLMTKEEKDAGSVKTRIQQDTEYKNRSYSEKFRDFFGLEEHIPTNKLGG